MDVCRYWRAWAPGFSWRQDQDVRIIASPIDTVWQRLDLERTLSCLCVGGTGIDAPLGQAKFSPQRLAGFEPYLRTQRRLKAYLMLPEDWEGDPDHEHNFVDPSSGHAAKELFWPLFRAPKVVVRCDTNRNAKLQIAAAFDENGVFPDHHFRCVGLGEISDRNHGWVNKLLSKHDPRSVLLWLTAVLNSPVANAWVATCSPPRGLLGVVLDTLPLPSRFDPVIPKLVERTRDIERSVTDEHPVWTTIVGAAQDEFMLLAAEINDRVLASYGLGSEEIASLARFLEGMTDPWVDGDETAHLPNKTAYRRITGKVLGVDVTRQTVTLDLPRYSRIAGQPLVDSASQAHARAGRCGRELNSPASRRQAGAIPRISTNPWLLREFRALPYSYLEPAQIERMAGFRSLDTTT